MNRYLLHLTVWALVWAIAALCQSPTATVTGRVTDSQGGAISQVKMVAKHPGTNIAYASISSEAGVYVIPSGRHVFNLMKLVPDAVVEVVTRKVIERFAGG